MFRGSAPDLNRSVVIVQVREPFAAWARKDPMFANVTTASLNVEATAYLLPDIVMEGEERELLRHYWKEIFAHELYAWSTDEREWPKRRTQMMFADWFEVVFSSLCYDMVDAPLEER